MEQKSPDNNISREAVNGLNKQLEDLKKQVRSAALEMEVLRVQMEDLKKEARRAVDLEKFVVPDDAHMAEINETVDLMEKAIMKERKNRRGISRREDPDALPAQKVDERLSLIVLKLRRKNCYIREIAAHTGLGVGTVHRIISRYENDSQIQNLVTGGVQMDMADYLLLRREEDDEEE